MRSTHGAKLTQSYIHGLWVREVKHEGEKKKNPHQKMFKNHYDVHFIGPLTQLQSHQYHRCLTDLIFLGLSETGQVQADVY